MTVASQVANGASIAASGATVFPFAYKIADATHIKVAVNGVVKALGADYTIAGAGLSAGGTITFNAPLLAGDKVVHLRSMPYARQNDYQNLGDFLSPTVNNDFDALVLMIQQLSSRDDRTLRLSDTALLPAGFSSEIPLGVPNASLIWNAGGTAIINGPYPGTGGGGGGGGADIQLRADLAAADGATRVGYAAGIMVADQLNTIGPIRADLASTAALKGAHMLAFKHPGAALTQSIFAVLQNGVPVTMFASPETLLVDATAATQAATNYAISSGRNGVYFPGGVTYRFAAASPSIDPGMASMHYYGDGRASQIIFEEGSSTGTAFQRKHLFRHDQDEIVKGELSFRNLNFSGTWTAGGNAERGGGVFFLNHYTTLNVTGCRFYDLAFTVMSCEAIRNVLVEGCTFELCSRDMVRTRSSFNQRIIGNTFRQCDDDAVALHQQDFITGVRIREGIVVTANIFEDCLGVKILGARMVTVSNNIFRRCKVHAIHCLTDPGEGNTNQFGINIHDNQIYDTLERVPFTAAASAIISVNGISRKGGTSTVQGIPGEHSSIVGWVLPWNHRNNEYTDAADALPPDFYVRIANNIIARTLPAVGTYEAWGYGRAMVANAALSNAAVNDAALRADTGINVSGDGRKVIIEGNIVSHVANCVKVEQQSGRYGHDGLVIRGNNFSDYRGAGVTFIDSGVLQYSTAIVEDNEFDGDPYHYHPDRSGNGSWLSLGPQGSGIIALNIAGLLVLNNRFRNVRYPIYTNNECPAFGNTIYCDPAAIGFNTLNKGVGAVPQAGPGYLIIVEGSDPVNAPTLYKVINTIPLRQSGAMPTTGKYVPGHFVANSGPSNNVHGWVRSTLGTAHVAGTDWKTVVCS